MLGRPLVLATFGFTACATLAVGIDWSPVRPLNINAATDGAVGDYYPHLAGDGQGHWVCVWCAAIPGAPNRDFDIFVARSADDGETWSEPVRLDPFATGPPEIEDDFHPHVYTDRAGVWIATWYSHDNHGGTIGDDTDILFSRSTDKGVTWTPSLPLNSDAASDQTLYDYASDAEPDLACDGTGHWVAIWSKRLTMSGDSDLYIAHSTDNGATWSELALFDPNMATDTGNDWGPRVATDGAGHWVIVWSADRALGGTLGTDTDVLFSLSTDGFVWTPPAALNTDAATDTVDDNTPRIVTDGTGRWVVVWYRGIYNVVDYDIMMSYSDDAGATWSPPAYVNTNALTDTERDQRPTLATDGQGEWVVVWYSRNSLGFPIGTDDNVHFARSRDGAMSWSPPAILNSSAFDPQDINYDWNPEIVAAGHGRWITVWYSQFNLGGTIGNDWDLLFATACTPPLAGDHECDGDVDLADFAAFQMCFDNAAPFATPCGRFDADDSGVVDLGDFIAMCAAATGPSPGP